MEVDESSISGANVKNYEKPKAFLIEWRDHYALGADAGAWMTDEGVNDGDCINKSVGWLVGEDEHYYTMSISLTSDGQYGEVMRIMKVGVTKKRALR